MTAGITHATLHWHYFSSRGQCCSYLTKHLLLHTVGLPHSLLNLALPNQMANIHLIPQKYTLFTGSTKKHTH